MKKMKRIFTALLAIALVACIPGLGYNKAKAETPHTYTIKFIPEMNEWRTQQLSAWDSSRENGDLNFVWGNIREGDSLVIVGGEGSPSFGDLHVNVKLANLTLYEVTGNIIVYADQKITDIYVLKGSIASVHGSYDNVYVYDNSACNVNSDVQYLYIGGESSMKMNVAAMGTVGHCKIENKGTLVREMFNVKSNTLRVVDGADKTDASNYSTTASATPAASSGSTATTTTTATTSTGTSPKTGEGLGMILLLLGAIGFGAASCYAKKKAF